jgi:uncharacterized protein (TIRG00374 family)
MTRRRIVMLLARALVAAAAVTYLVLALSWKDLVVLPTRFSAAGWPANLPAASYPVLFTTHSGVVVDCPGLGRRALGKTCFGGQPTQAHLRLGLHSVLIQAHIGLASLCLAMTALAVPLQAFRWWLLLRSRGLAPGYPTTLRLHLIGCFWNCLFPGLTGGDAVKAWKVAAASGRTADAITSVIVDRVLGLVALVSLSAGVGATLIADPSHHQLIVRVWGLLALMLIASLLWLSPAMQRILRLSWLAQRLRSHLRMVGMVIDALGAYQRHRATLLAGFVCSCAGHVLIIGGCMVAGRALGMSTPWTNLAVLLPMVFLIGALPISLLGLGVMEVAAMTLIGGDANHIVGMLAMTRLSLLLCALPGGWYVIAGHGHWGIARAREATRLPA